MALWSDQPWEGGPWTQEAPSTPAKPGRMGKGWAGSEGRKRQQRKQARGPGLQTGLKGMRSGGARGGGSTTDGGSRWEGGGRAVWKNGMGLGPGAAGLAKPHGLGDTGEALSLPAPPPPWTWR